MRHVNSVNHVNSVSSVNSFNSVNSVNSVNSLNSVNSVNSYGAVLPPSPMVFLSIGLVVTGFQSTQVLRTFMILEKSSPMLLNC